MSLLALEQVGKRCRDGLRERVLLGGVSLQIDPGELAVVWGLRRSGRSTLLRIAAGMQAPDTGMVRFEGRDLAEHGEEVVGVGIGYVRRALRSAEGETVLEEATVGLLARGVGRRAARARAQAALERTGARGCATLRLGELDGAEEVRVGLARTLALQPRLLVVDEPVKGVDLLERDGILALLRSLADEGMAVLASAGEATALSGADRAMVLGEGELRGSPRPELAPVLPLRRATGGG